MTTRKQRQAQAHHIIDLLTAAEPMREDATNPAAYRKVVRSRIRGEHWDHILTELEAGATVEAIVADLTATEPPSTEPRPPELPTVVDDGWQPLDPTERSRARTRLEAIRQNMRKQC